MTRKSSTDSSVALDVNNISSLTVARLKEELEKRNLDVKGLKAVLVDRLKTAMSEEVSNSHKPLEKPESPKKESAAPLSPVKQSPSPEKVAEKLPSPLKQEVNPASPSKGAATENPPPSPVKAFLKPTSPTKVVESTVGPLKVVDRPASPAKIEKPDSSGNVLERPNSPAKQSEKATPVTAPPSSPAKVPAPAPSSPIKIIAAPALAATSSPAKQLAVTSPTKIASAQGSPEKLAAPSSPVKPSGPLSPTKIAVKPLSPSKDVEMKSPSQIKDKEIKRPLEVASPTSPAKRSKIEGFIVMIKNFTRPLNLDDLKDDLQKYGKYGEFWMDKFRTMCLVSFSTKESAESAVKGMDRINYQPIGGKILEARIFTHQEAEDTMNAATGQTSAKSQDSEIAKSITASVPPKPAPSAAPPKKISPITAPSPSDLREQVLNAAKPSDKGNEQPPKAVLGPLKHTKAEPSITYREYNE